MTTAPAAEFSRKAALVMHSPHVLALPVDEQFALRDAFEQATSVEDLPGHLRALFEGELHDLVVEAQFEEHLHPRDRRGQWTDKLKPWLRHPPHLGLAPTRQRVSEHRQRERGEPDRLDAEFAEWGQTLSAADREMLMRYATGRSRKLNDMLRGQEVSFDTTNVAGVRDSKEALQSDGDALDAILAKHTLAQDTLTFRGVDDFERVFGVGLDDAEKLVGAEFDDPAFMSTTARRSVVERNFGAQDEQGVPAILHLTVAAGTGAAWLPVGLPERQRPGMGGNVAKLRKEGELLLARGRKLRVTAVQVEHVAEQQDRRKGWEGVTYPGYARIVLHAEVS